MNPVSPIPMTTFNGKFMMPIGGLLGD